MQTHRNTDTRCAPRAEMQSRRWYAERSSEEPRRVVCWILQASLPPHVTTAMYALCSEQHTAVLLTKYNLCAFCSDAGSCQAPCPRHGNSFEAQKNIIAELQAFHFPVSASVGLFVTVFVTKDRCMQNLGIIGNPPSVWWSTDTITSFGGAPLIYSSSILP